MTRTRAIIFFLVLIIILGIAAIVVRLAQGYKLDIHKRSLKPTGLLAATSTPDGAKVFIDNKLSSATNTTISLPPGSYEIEIKKDGYTSWKKTLEIEKELVTKTDAYLFPTVPNLQSLTFTSAISPLLSPDGTRVVYKVSGDELDKNGLWVLDLSESPLGIASREPRLILASAPKGRDFSQAELEWSPDSKQLLVTLKQAKKEEKFLIDAGSLTKAIDLVDISANLLLIKNRWQKEIETRQEQKMAKMPEELKEMLLDSTKDIIFSPDETKILYTATASARLAEEYRPPLPATSTQKQERNLKSGKIYVYDIKEDKNFRLMEEMKTIPLYWFATSRHLIVVEEDKVEILEYDGANQTTIYSGPFENAFAFPFPSGTRLLILTTLGKDLPLNLYAVSLR
jgi:hypothetical protein